MSKRTGRIEDYIADLMQEHPDDVVMNDELIFLQHGFKNRAVSDLRCKEDYQMLCQFNGEGMLLRVLNSKEIWCIPWLDIFEPGREHLNFTSVHGRDFRLHREGTTLLIWRIGREDKGPLVVPITSPTLQTP